MILLPIAKPIASLPPLRTLAELAPLYAPFNLTGMQRDRIAAQRETIIRANEVRSSSSFVRL